MKPINALIGIMSAATLAGCMTRMPLNLRAMSSSFSGDGVGETTGRTVDLNKKGLIIADGGMGQKAPEYTIPALTATQSAPVDTIFITVQDSRDRVPVLIRDHTFDRTTNVTEILGRRGLRVNQLYANEIQKLDAGKWFSPAFMGTRVPTFQEALAVIPRGQKILVEHRTLKPQSLVDIARSANRMDDLIFVTGDVRYLTELQKVAPQALVIYKIRNLEDPQLANVQKNFPLKGIAVPEGLITPDLIKRYQDLNLKVYALGVDDKSRAQILIGAGIDGVVTTRPEVITPK